MNTIWPKEWQAWNTAALQSVFPTGASCLTSSTSPPHLRCQAEEIHHTGKRGVGHDLDLFFIIAPFQLNVKEPLLNCSTVEDC
jgi:hypothetical protein